MSSSRGSSSNLFDEDDEEKVQVNGWSSSSETNHALTLLSDQQSKFMNLLQILRGFTINMRGSYATTSSGGSHLVLSTKSLQEDWEVTR